MASVLNRDDLPIWISRIAGECAVDVESIASNRRIAVNGPVACTEVPNISRGTVEDSFGGAWTSRLFLCRTYNRQELLQTCHDVGLEPVQELWLSGVHKALRAGGICFELRRR